jgi:hypothetical protein
MARRRWICLMLVSAAFAALAAHQPTGAAATSCTKHITVSAGTSASCVFAVAGTRVAARGVSLAPGVSVRPYVPNPAITGVRVTIYDGGGRVLQRCSAYDYGVAACSKLGRVSAPVGTVLRCAVNAWTDATVGSGHGVFSCGNR